MQYQVDHIDEYAEQQERILVLLRNHLRKMAEPKRKIQFKDELDNDDATVENPDANKMQQVRGKAREDANKNPDQIKNLVEEHDADMRVAQRRYAQAQAEREHPRQLSDRLIELPPKLDHKRVVQTRAKRASSSNDTLRATIWRHQRHAQGRGAAVAKTVLYVEHTIKTKRALHQNHCAHLGG